MSAVQPRLPGASVVDICAGSGALGLEALSRGAEKVTFVERSATSLAALRANIEALGAGDETRVLRANAIDYVKGLEAGSFDLALADPPYERGLATRIAEAYIEKPFATELWIEHSRRETLPETPGGHTRRYGDTLLTTLTGDHV